MTNTRITDPEILESRCQNWCIQIYVKLTTLDIPLSFGGFAFARALEALVDFVAAMAFQG
jgi:hypothetical protein